MSRSCCGLLLWLLAAGALPAGGQAAAPAEPPRFEVVSIRRDVAPAPPIIIGAQPGLSLTADGFRCRGPLMFLLMVAYAPGNGNGYLDTGRIEGAPEWVKSVNDRYEVTGKVAEKDLPQWQNVTQRRAMLQAMVRALLAERMKLTAHMESRTMPVYELQVAKGGPKFQATATLGDNEQKDWSTWAMTAPGGGMVMPGKVPGEMSFHAVTMPVLAEQTLTIFAGRPVVDRTGLKGEYDLQFLLPRSMSPASAPDDGGVSIFSVVQDHLGLKLEPAKGQVETLVIDHVERPSEN